MVLNNTHFRQIIVVDDDFASLYLAKLVLEEASISETVLTFIQSPKALAHILQHCTGDNAAKEDCPDLVLLDLNMPLMDGFEFLEGLHKAGLNQFIKTKVVVLSSSNSPQDRRGVEDYNVRDFIQKPLTEEQLASLLP